MRLSATEVNAINKTVQDFAGEDLKKIYLHGSRVDDSLKGGDIDLIIVVSPEAKRPINVRLHYLLRDLKQAIGDQRIDVIIASEDDLLHDPFLQVGMTKAQLLLDNAAH